MTNLPDEAMYGRADVPHNPRQPEFDEHVPRPDLLPRFDEPALNLHRSRSPVKRRAQNRQIGIRGGHFCTITEFSGKPQSVSTRRFLESLLDLQNLPVDNLVREKSQAGGGTPSVGRN